MNARITIYGGDRLPGPGVRFNAVKHWQLHVDDWFIADTSHPVMAELYQKIADELNHPAKYVFDSSVPLGQTYGLASAGTQGWREALDAAPILDFDKPATIGTDMPAWEGNESIRDELPGQSAHARDTAAMQRLSERVSRLEARNAHEDRDVTEGRRLAVAALKLLLRRLESE